MWGRYPAPVKKSSDTKDTKDPRKIKCINLTAKRAKAAKRNKNERHGKILEERVDSRITAFRNSRSSWIPQEHSLLNTLIPRQVDETKTGSDHVNQHFCL